MDTVRTKSNAQIVPFGMDAANPNYVGGLIKGHYAGNELLWATALDITYMEVTIIILSLYEVML